MRRSRPTLRGVTPAPSPTPETLPAVPFGAALRFWAMLGCTSFGGPAAQIACLHEELVVRRRWLPAARFDHALDVCMLLPGPEAQQLATYSGWLLHGTRGGLAAGILFVLPAAVLLFALSWLYAAFGTLPAVAGVLWGCKAVVVALVLDAVVRLGRRAVRRPGDAVLASASLALLHAGVPFPWLVLGAAVVGRLLPDRAGAEAPPTLPTAPAPWRRTGRGLALGLCLWGAPLAGLVLLGEPLQLVVAQYLFYSGAALVTFGGAYAVLAYVLQAAAGPYGWITSAQALDGLALAETTPGPLIMVVQFVGFMAAFRDAGGLPPMLAATFGGLLATWVTFTPCFLWIFAGAPYIETMRGNKALAGALSAITAAVVGVILNLSIWFALHTLFRQTFEVRSLGLAFDAPVLTSVDFAALVLSIAAATAIFRFKMGMLVVLAASCGAGVLLRLAGLI